MLRLRRSQTGISLLLFLFLVLGIGATVVLSAGSSSRGKMEQERKTQLALQQAKDALIAYATSVYPVANDRPGDLPCPDINIDGKKENSCGNANGTTGQTVRLGRLPWKDLGVADLRDSTGERLWYAVSNNFKENFRHLPLNSDTTGTIQVLEADGTVISNVIAVVIAPGPPLQRLNSAAFQDRSPSGENDPTNYLDETATEDNGNFVDGTANGFVNGIIRDVQGRILVNDSVLYITYDELMPLLEKTVATTVKGCLTSYAGYNANGYNNMGRYPWAADMAASAAGNYADTPATLFGRIPDTLLNSGISSANMLTAWGPIPSCTISDPWFKNNWREQVFFAIADAYKPGSTLPICGICLTVSAVSNARVSIMVSRKALAGQNRSSISDKSAIANYLEGGNATSNDGIFEISALSTTFNDLLVFK